MTLMVFSRRVNDTVKVSTGLGLSWLGDLLLAAIENCTFSTLSLRDLTTTIMDSHSCLLNVKVLWTEGSSAFPSLLTRLTIWLAGRC